jgi:hypothetical protein
MQLWVNEQEYAPTEGDYFLQFILFKCLPKSWMTGRVGWLVFAVQGCWVMGKGMYQVQ